MENKIMVLYSYAFCKNTVMRNFELVYGCHKLSFLLQTDEFLARHLEEKARMRQLQQEEKRKVLFNL